MPTTYTGGGYPNWLVGEYPGLEGISTALKGFGALMKNPGYNQLTASAASDPGAGQYQGATEGGAPLGAGAGLFGRLMAGNYGADVQGQAAQQQGQTNAAQGKVQAGQAAGSLMAGQQEANLALEAAKNQQAAQQLGLFTQLIGGKDLSSLVGLFQPTSASQVPTPSSPSTPLDSGTGAVPGGPQSTGGPISETNIAGSAGTTPLVSPPADTSGLPVGAAATALPSSGLWNWLTSIFSSGGGAAALTA